MKSRIIFRPATEKDFNTILRLEEESFNSHDRLYEDELTELFKDFSEGFFMILAGDETAGSLIFLIEEGRGYIESIAIDSRFKRMGLGQAAVRFIIETVRGKGITEIDLHVRTDNVKAIALYEKEGFRRIQEVKGFYQDGETAFLYTLKK